MRFPHPFWLAVRMYVLYCRYLQVQVSMESVDLNALLQYFQHDMIEINTEESPF